jgi:hypothetical protein
MRGDLVLTPAERSTDNSGRDHQRRLGNPSPTHGQPPITELIPLRFDVNARCRVPARRRYVGSFT